MFRELASALVFVCSVATAQTFPAARFGKLTRDKVDHAPIIQRAIEAAELAGGGTVVVAPGAYWVAIDGSGTALRIPAGVTLDLRGVELRLMENEARAYQVVLFTGREKPSALIGGRIVGDRSRHLGTDGEWGMCISVRGAIGVTIRDTKTFDCWGDGIYVGTDLAGAAIPSRRVTIEGVEAGYNRRNNISIVAAVGFSISDVRLHNAGGTPPESGIDLEPNEDDMVENGKIIRMTTEHNAGYGFAIDGEVGTVRRITMDQVRSEGNGRSGFLLRKTHQLRVRNLHTLRNKGNGLSIVFANDVSVEMLHAHHNLGPVLYASAATGVRLRRVTFSGTPTGVEPFLVDSRSTVEVLR